MHRLGENKSGKKKMDVERKQQSCVEKLERRLDVNDIDFIGGILMGFATKPRHNIKGRLITSTSDGNQLKRKREYLLDDSNAEIIDPIARKKRREDEDAVKAQALANEPKMSSKKRKRLDAYIVRKLKKEGRKELIASLA